MWTDEAVRELFAENRIGIGGCPPAETLTRAVIGGLPRDEAEAVADHLADCGDCAEDAQALRSLESWAGRAALDGATPGRRTREIATRRWTKHPLSGVAAVLLLATVALAGGLVHVRNQARKAQAELQARLDAASVSGKGAVAAAPQAFPNVAIVDLLPASEARGANVPVVPPGAPLVVAVLKVPPATPRYADYSVEVWHGGRLASHVKGLHLGPDEAFRLALPAAAFAPGESSVRLIGLQAGREALLQKYVVRSSP